MRHLRRFGFALSYVTAFPFLEKPQDESEISGLSKYLPAVGLVIGAMLSMLSWLLLHWSADRQAAAVIVLFAWVIVTGAIHLDGLMDTADGVFSHRSPERMLEIMRDSRVGNFGAIAGMLLLLCKWSALAALMNSWHCWPVMVLVPAWARWTEVAVIGLYPYARQEGMGKIWHDTTSRMDILRALPVPLLASLLLFSIAPAPLLTATCAATVGSGMLAAAYIYGNLHAQTGDTYGATVEIAEACGLAVCTLLLPG